MPPAISVMIVSDDRLFAEAVRTSLRSWQDLLVVEVAGEPFAARTTPHPDVVLIEAGSSRDQALARTWEIREALAGSKVVIFGLDDEDNNVVDFIEAGASGYILKSTTLPGLVKAIRAVHGGQTLCSPRIAASVLSRIAELARSNGKSEPGHFEPLTQREKEVLRLLSAGLGNKEIAHRLHVTVQTVKNHVHSILHKLQVHRRRDAVRRGYELGLLIHPHD